MLDVPNGLFVLILLVQSLGAALIAAIGIIIQGMRKDVRDLTTGLSELRETLHSDFIRKDVFDAYKGDIKEDITKVQLALGRHETQIAVIEHKSGVGIG